ncbi:hypothetical protein B0H16DRAFT_1732288 [Mycena metata]|uniref:Uncharacterized protein n=1 Tax=Mycena metata TaxID=1033252 RepID=A0AAD7MUP3_9AGAR|nr:hypothetical protein B0H16DRAFT_1732288 [Mycena metata]
MNGGQQLFEISVTTPGTPFGATQYELPFTTADRTPIVEGAYVMCKVCPFRADTPSEDDESEKGIFKRTYGLHSIDAIRFCRNPNNLWD